MNQTRETSAFRHHIEDIQNRQSNLGLSGANIQSTGLLDRSEGNSFPAGGNLTPASLQIAQLQAQLTLQRLRLVQSAVGGGAMAAASVLTQVLSGVPALSSPRGHGPPGGAHLGSTFPTGALALPPPASTLEALVEGGGIRGGGVRGYFPQALLGPVPGAPFKSGTDHRSRHSFLGLPPSADGRNAPPTKTGTLYDPEEPTTDGKYSGAGQAELSARVTAAHPQHEPGKSFSGPMALLPRQRDDFDGVTPTQLPHHCTICDKKVFNLTEWDHHVSGKLHLQNCALYSDSSYGGSACFPPFSSGCLSSSTNNSLSLSSASQGISTGSNPAYVPSAPMKTHDLTGNGYESHHSVSKRKALLGSRVVHICNIPEGSCTENDVINLGLPFGKMTNYILMRSTHQAFLEMACTEGAQAMVQYYQENPAMISDRKLLVHISKRYTELRLKKPGRDVESIIQDINSQREREEVEGYLQERARSRSPVPHPLSPLHEAWPQDHRKPRPKGWSSRRVERRSRERYFRTTAQDRASPYRNKEENFYKMADQSPRQRCQDSDGRTNRRAGEGPHRARNCAPEGPEASDYREPGSPGRGRSRNQSAKQEIWKEEESENGGDEGGNDSEVEEESWYPQNMDELLTVDEVGEEDDDIIEPDLPELQEKPEAQNVAVGDALAADALDGVQYGVTPEGSAEEMSEECPRLAEKLSHNLKVILEQPEPRATAADIQPPNHEVSKPANCVTKQSAQITKATDKAVQDKDEHFGGIPVRDDSRALHQSPSMHCKAVSKCSIPLGVEFVVQRSGFFCNLCGLFYASEEAAKMVHCKSTVHYKNLQKYLSQPRSRTAHSQP